METIKKYLEGHVSDETEISVFLDRNETEIREFVINRWNEHCRQSAASEIQPVESEENTGQNAEKESPPENTGEPLENTGENAEKHLSPENITITADNNNTKMLKKFDSGKPHDSKKAGENALAFQIKNKQIIMPNGKKGQEYVAPFRIEDIGFLDVTAFHLDNLPKGLTFSNEENAILGTPEEAGDFKAILHCLNKDGRKAEKDILIIINPDPRDLWSKNIPTPKDTEYYKPDSDKLFVPVKSKITKGIPGLGKKEIPCKDMVAASQRGRSHAIEGKPRDDDFALYFDNETEWYVMVVADGAGSAKYSRKGSQIACQTAMNVCKAKLLASKEKLLKNRNSENRNETCKILQEIIGNAVFESYKAIEKEAQTKNAPVKNYATTLLMTLCRKFEYGWIVASWWVGDGGIGIYSAEPQDLKIMGEPDGGEFAGQTRFLTMPEIIKNDLYRRMRFESVQDFKALILMTDGVTDPKFETDANLNRIEKWHALWDDLNGNNEDGAKVDFTDDNEQSADQLLKWLDFWSKGNHDDRTIAILF